MLGSEKTLTCAPCNNNVGFLQRTNSLEDKSRIVSSLKERQSSKSLLACENSEKESRFRRTETDFSNLYARGKHFTVSPCPSSGMSLSSLALISSGSAATFRPWLFLKVAPCLCFLEAALAVYAGFLKCSFMYFRLILCSSASAVPGVTPDPASGGE